MPTFERSLQTSDLTVNKVLLSADQTEPNTPTTPTANLVMGDAFTQAEVNEIISRRQSQEYFTPTATSINTVGNTESKINEEKLAIFNNTPSDVDSEQPDEAGLIWDVFIIVQNTDTTPNNRKPFIGNSTGSFYARGLDGTFDTPDGSVSVPAISTSGSVWGNGFGENHDSGRRVTYLWDATLDTFQYSVGSTEHNKALTRIGYIKANQLTQISFFETDARSQTDGTAFFIPGFHATLNSTLGFGVRLQHEFAAFKQIRPYYTATEEQNVLDWLKGWAKFFIDNMIAMANNGSFNNLTVNDQTDAAILAKHDEDDDYTGDTSIYTPWQNFRSNTTQNPNGRGATFYQFFRITNRDLEGLAMAFELGCWLKKYRPNDSDSDYLVNGGKLRFKLEFLMQVTPYREQNENTLARIEYQRETDTGSTGKAATRYSSVVTANLIKMAHAEKLYIGTTELYDYNTRNGLNYISTSGRHVFTACLNSDDITKSLYNYCIELTRLLADEIDIFDHRTGTQINDVGNNGLVRRLALFYFPLGNKHWNDSTIKTIYKGNYPNLPHSTNPAPTGPFSVLTGVFGLHLPVPFFFDMENIN